MCQEHRQSGPFFKSTTAEYAKPSSSPLDLHGRKENGPDRPRWVPLLVANRYSEGYGALIAAQPEPRGNCRSTRLFPGYASDHIEGLNRSLLAGPIVFTPVVERGCRAISFEGRITGNCSYLEAHILRLFARSLNRKRVAQRWIRLAAQGGGFSAALRGSALQSLDRRRKDLTWPRRSMWWCYPHCPLTGPSGHELRPQSLRT